MIEILFIALKFISMKMSMIILFLQIFHCYGQQDSSLLTYNKAGTKYYIEDKRVKPKKLKTMLLSNPDSKYFFRKYQQENFIGQAFFIPFFLNVALVHNEAKPQFFSRKNFGVDLLTTLSMVASVYLLAHSFKHLKKSANAYNKAKSLVLF